MSALDDLVAYVNGLLEESGGALESADGIRNDLLPIVSHIRAEALRETASILEPAAPEVSFFGPTFGPQVAAWLRMLADSKAVTR
jgi:hypothetical protein